MDISLNTVNSTCFNFTWSFNENEPYLDTINGVELLLNSYEIYNYSIDDTGYYYNRNFTDTFEVCGLLPDTEYNVTGMLFGNDRMSNHTRMSVTTTNYNIRDITHIFVGHVNTSTNVLLVWNETQIPGDSYFDSAYSYYEVEITSDTSFNYTNYNLTSRYLIFNLENGVYNISVRPVLNVTLYEHQYIGDWFSLEFEIFVTPSTTDTSTQTSTETTTQTTSSSSSSSSSSSTVSSSSSSNSVVPDNNDDDGLSTALIVLIVLAVVLFLLLCAIFVIRYNEKKNNDMISRLTGRNKSTDRNPAVAYSNSSYQDPGFSNQDLFPDARYDPGYGDVIVSEHSEVGRGAIKNDSYDDHYFNC
jgi:hypothetical protein